MRAAVTDIKSIVADARSRKLPVWFVEWPGREEGAVAELNHMNPDWMRALEPLGTVLTGHALNTRECWGFQDLGHPSESGQRAIAEVVTQAIMSGRSAADLATEPTCAAVPGIGPGKTPYVTW